MVYRIKLFQRKKDHAMKDKKKFEILLKAINRIYNENCEFHELIDAIIIDVCTEEGALPEQFFLRLRKTHNALQLSVFFFSFFL